MIILRSSEPQGSFSSPSLDIKNTSFKFELNLPENIGELVGEGELVISVETKGNWSFFAPKNMTRQLYQRRLNQSVAEQFCVEQGGHLVSLCSEEEQYELKKISRRGFWFGGMRTSEEKNWKWFDGTIWGYQNWFHNQLNNKTGFDCISKMGNGLPHRAK